MSIIMITHISLDSLSAERGALLFSLIETNSWVNNPDAGDLRRHPTHYDVTVRNMKNMHIDSGSSHWHSIESIKWRNMRG